MPLDHEPLAQRRLKRRFLRAGQRGHAVGPAIDGPYGYEGQELITIERLYAGKIDSEAVRTIIALKRAPFHPALPPRRGDPQRLEQPADGEERRLAPAVIIDVAREAH